jgi:hypothetical protein
MYFPWCTSLQNLKSIKQRVLKKYWLVSIFLCPIWPLDLWSFNFKFIVVIYFSWCTSLQSLKSVKQSLLKILNGQNIPIFSLKWPWTLTYWPQNQFSLLITHPHMKYFNNLVKSSQDIERKSSGLQTGAKKYAPLLRRGS